MGMKPPCRPGNTQVFEVQEQSCDWISCTANLHAFNAYDCGCTSNVHVGLNEAHLVPRKFPRVCRVCSSSELAMAP